jgi:zeaxanthin glucosyltransferase
MQRGTGARHIGAICDPSLTHVAAMVTIGRELAARGHRFTLFYTGSAPQFERCEGVEFERLGNKGNDPSREYLARMSRSQGLNLRAVRAYGRGIIRLICEEGPGLLRERRVELLLGDQSQPAAGTVAEIQGIPFVTIAIALPYNREPEIPPFFTGWKYRDGRWGRMRNRAGYGVADWLARPMKGLLNSYRKRAGLPEYASLDETYSRLAQISQLVRELDYPRKRLPDCFHYVGPFGGRPMRAGGFPYERLNGKPLVYASLGTILDGRKALWPAILSAAAGMDAQLVLSLGGVAQPEAVEGMAGDAVVVEYAPQQELLERARVAITPAGINTVLEALGRGVPVLALPVTNDQPGIAARVEAAGAGRALGAAGRMVTGIRKALRGLLEEPAYRQRAETLQRAIRASGGSREAVDIILQVLESGSAVKGSQAAGGTG